MVPPPDAQVKVIWDVESGVATRVVGLAGKAWALIVNTVSPETPLTVAETVELPMPALVARPELSMVATAVVAEAQVAVAVRSVVELSE